MVKRVGYKSLLLSLSVICLSLLALLSSSSATAQTSASEVVLYPSTASVKIGNWTTVADATAAGGARIQSNDNGAAKLSTPLANPASYFEMTFSAQAGTAYRLWMRGKAQNNFWGNDSVFVQFSGSVTSTGSPTYRIGTTSAAEYNLEDCSGYGLSGWGWQDNGWGAGVMGPLLYFQTTGTQTIRVQVKEDGLGIDQILLSSQTYRNSSPGALKNDNTIVPPVSAPPPPPPPPPAPPALPGEVVIYASQASARVGNFSVVADPSAAGGSRIYNADHGAAKVTTPQANPASYFEMTFDAQAGTAYRLWVRSKADNNSPYNDSYYVQFSGSVTSTGSPTYRIGTTSAADINLEECSGCTVSGWGWQDNGWGVGVLGPLVFFQSSGPQTLRLQPREDGFSIDQVVLSPLNYIVVSPGATRNDTTILASTVSGGTPPPPANQPPQVSASASVTSGTTPLGISFFSNASDPDGYINSYSWDFGNGQTSTQASPATTYTAAGTYTARLTVTDNDGATSSASVVITVTNPIPPPPSGNVSLRILSWNVAFGRGTDNVANLDRQATYMANQSPDVIGLCEADVNAGNMPQTLTDLMTQKTGVTWRYHFVPKYPGCPEGNVIITKWQVVSTSHRYLSYQRSVAQMTINVNGKLINFFATHLDNNSSTYRNIEAGELKSFMSGFAEPRFVVGDFNAGPDLSEIGQMTSSYHDSWEVARLAGTATAYPDNPVLWMTRTRRGRIDYIFHSRGAGNVTVTGMSIPDIRDLSRLPVINLGTLDDRGVRPSDHNLVVGTFQIQ